MSDIAIYDNETETFEKAERAKKTNKLLPAVFMLMIIGMICGAIAVSVSTKETLDTFDFILGSFTAQRVQQSLFTSFINSLLSSGSLMLILLTAGFCAVAQPVSLFVPFFRGLGLGLSMGYFYLYHGLKGVGFCVVLILPPAVLSSIAIILGTRESLRFSHFTLKLILGKENDKGLEAVKTYGLKFLILAGMILAAALIDCLLTFLFARFFTF